MSRIERIRGRRIWDTRGRPALEVEITLDSGASSFASAPPPLRALPGTPIELHDGGAAFGGRGVSLAAGIVSERIHGALRGLDVRDQETIDRRLLVLDGTPDIGRCGVNSVLATSIAAALGAAAANELPLWRHLGCEPRPTLPMPLVELLGVSDRNTNDGLALAAVHLVPFGADDMVAALDLVGRGVRVAGQQLRNGGRDAPETGLGGYRNPFDQAEDALEFAVRSIERAGFTAGEDFALALEFAAGTFGSRGTYVIAREGRRCDAAALMARQLEWLGRYPIVAFIDPHAADDGAAWPVLTRAAGQGVKIAGGDLLISSPQRIAAAAEASACNTLSLSLAHAGTLTQARAALSVARASGWNVILAGGEGGAGDGWLAHLAVAEGIELMQAGGLLGGGNAARWNETLRLAEQLPGGGRLPPRERFRW